MTGGSHAAPAPTSAVTLARFTFAERLIHWWVGITFLFLLLTGLAFAHPRLFWLTALVGGGPTARALHPWIGLLFSLGLGLMFFLWAAEMRVDASDRAWLRALKAYARHQKDRVPATGKYNGGQKLFFWSQIVLGVVHLLTGLPLWLPDAFGASWLVLCRLVHYVTTVAGGLLIILHTYLGTVAFPGTFRSMTRGTVTADWAKLHHPLWFEDRSSRG